MCTCTYVWHAVQCKQVRGLDVGARRAGPAGLARARLLVGVSILQDEAHINPFIMYSMVVCI